MHLNNAYEYVAACVEHEILSYFEMRCHLDPAQVEAEICRDITASHVGTVAQDLIYSEYKDFIYGVLILVSCPRHSSVHLLLSVADLPLPGALARF